jgi:hypothetical protein
MAGMFRSGDLTSRMLQDVPDGMAALFHEECKHQPAIHPT